MILACAMAATISLSCPTTKVENVSSLPWNEEDQKSLEFNLSRCAQIYDDAPCLKLFRKVGERSYHAICGEP